jgi:hypothetical protein
MKTCIQYQTLLADYADGHLIERERLDRTWPNVQSVGRNWPASGG